MANPLISEPHPNSKERTYAGYITDLLELGVTIEDACARAGISERTYYNWCNRGRDERDRVAGNSRASVRASEAPYVQFLQDVTRARASARIASVATLRTAIKGYTQRERRVETYTETRLRRLETGEQVPYEYRRETVADTEREIAGDWRAALEVLKRTDPANWSDRIRLDDWHSDAIEGIRAGEIGYQELVEAFGDPDLATQLFHQAGVQVQVETTTDE